MPRPQYHKITRPSPKVDKFLGTLEAPVMEYIWRTGSATVRDAAVHLKPTRPVAYNTVLTVMTRLTEKGLLARELEGKTYHYRAARSRAHSAASAPPDCEVVEKLADLQSDVARAHDDQTLSGRKFRPRAFFVQCALA